VSLPTTKPALHLKEVALMKEGRFTEETLIRDELGSHLKAKKTTAEESRSIRLRLTRHQMRMPSYLVKHHPDGFYFGETNAEGQRHGRGLFLWPSCNLFYFGEWKNDMRCGRGVSLSNISTTTTTTTLVMYDGEWRDDKRCGRGTAVFRNNIYAGEWSNDLQNGQGEEWWVHGDKYKGVFEKGKKSGYGVYWYHASGDRYEGDWLNDSMHGVGVYHFGLEAHPCQLYRGEFRENIKTGKGVIRWKDGSTYQGDIVNNTIEGQGCLSFVPRGYTFEGVVSRTQLRRGVMKWPNGDFWKGHFMVGEDGELRVESEGELTLAETGNIVKGRWADYSMKNGKGEMVMWVKEENREVKGKWIEGRFEPTPSLLTQILN